MNILTGKIINVFGRVQGVGFRYNTYRYAQKKLLTGSVKNLQDGSVQIVAFGTSTQLKELIHWLEQGGPPAAQITNIISTDTTMAPPDSFRVITKSD